MRGWGARRRLEEADARVKKLKAGFIGGGGGRGEDGGASGGGEDAGTSGAAASGGAEVVGPSTRRRRLGVLREYVARGRLLSGALARVGGRAAGGSLPFSRDVLHGGWRVVAGRAMTDASTQGRQRPTTAGLHYM